MATRDLGAPCLRALACLLGAGLTCFTGFARAAGPERGGFSWEDLPVLYFKGGLNAYWQVYDWTGTNQDIAYRHGFRSISLVDPYSNRAEGAKERIDVEPGARNPWAKPARFERVMKADINRVPGEGAYVLDIELPFELSAKAAWENESARKKSWAKSQASFEKQYLSEWATWYTKPLQWAREAHPKSRLGVYGLSPFRRDWWGISGKNTDEIRSSHADDKKIWSYVEPYVDFIIADVYVPYALPEAIYYIAANIEWNRRQTDSEKPIYAYEWMRYHESNSKENNRELDSYLVEAMAIVPYFSGASAVVLWGHEPQLRPGDGRPYRQLPLFMKSLARVAGLSEQIGAGRLVIDEPAHDVWRSRKPLIRRVEVTKSECLFLVIDPVQDELATSTHPVTCDSRHFNLQTRGKHVTLARTVKDELEYH